MGSEDFWGIQITEELWNQSAHQNVFGASWNDVWANVGFRLPEWQTVKMTFFAPCILWNCKLLKFVFYSSHKNLFFGVISYNLLHYFTTLKKCKKRCKPLGTDTSLIQTALYYGQFPMSCQNSHIFSFKENLYNLDSVSHGQRTLNLSNQQRVNSYKLNLFIIDTAVIRWW